MAIRTLISNPRLWPFQRLGIGFILQDTPIAPPIVPPVATARETPPPRHTFQQGPNLEQNSFNHTTQQHGATTQQHNNTTTQQRSSIPQDQTRPDEASYSSRPAKPTREGTGLTQHRNNIFKAEPAFEHWPRLWRQAFLKGAPKPAPLVWTYPELGLDLLSQGNKERSTFFRSLLKELSLPKGGSAFWASALPQEEALAESPKELSGESPEEAPGELSGRNPSSTETSDSRSLNYEPSIFQAGLAYIQPKIIVVFGRPCLEGVFPNTHPELKTLSDFQQAIVLGIKVLLLPPITQMQDSQGKTAVAVPFIRAALSGIFS